MSSTDNSIAQMIGGQQRPNMIHASPEMGKKNSQSMIEFMQVAQSSSIGEDKPLRASDPIRSSSNQKPGVAQNNASSISGVDIGDYAFLTGVREVDDDIDTLKSNG